MVRTGMRVLVSVVCVVCAAEFAAGQSGASAEAAAPCCQVDTVALSGHDSLPAISPATNPSTSFRKVVDEVSLSFSVTDQKGRPVPDLSPGDISIVDNHQAVASAHLSRERVPLRVGVLVDGSESVADGYGFERQVASEFLRQIMRPQFDQGFVLGFGARWKLIQPLTRDPEAMISALGQVEHSSLTSLYDAVAAACSGPMAQASSEGARRALLLLSDGQDNDSATDLEQAIRTAQRTDVVVYAVAIRGRNWDPGGERILLELTAATGGRAYVARGVEQYRAAFAAIEQELRSGYLLSFKPVGARDGRFHPVQIAVRGGSLRVHARPGYFAPKD